MKYLVALTAIGCLAVSIVAFATTYHPVKVDGIGFEKDKHPEPDRDFKVLRLLTRQDLKSQMGQLALQQVAAMHAAAEQERRLELIRTKFPGYKLSAVSWTLIFKKVSQEDDGVHVELETIPSLIADNRPAAVIMGTMNESWVLKKKRDKVECKCLNRTIDPTVGFVID